MFSAVESSPLCSVSMFINVSLTQHVLYTAIVHSYCTQLLYTAIVHSYSTQLLYTAIVHSYCTQLLYTAIFIFFTLILPRILIDFFLNNQPEAPIIPILFCYKTLRVSGIFSAHHQGFSTVHSALVIFMQTLMTAFTVRMELQFHPESAWTNFITE
jgi:hypothetical protein